MRSILNLSVYTSSGSTIPRPAAIDFRSGNSLSTDETSLLLGASLGGPDEPVREKRVLIKNGIDGADDIIRGSCIELILWGEKTLMQLFQRFI